LPNQISKLSFSVFDVVKKFESVRPEFIAYRDASFLPCTYNCTLAHCLRGFETALRAGIFALESFDLNAYTFYEKVSNGDINWIIPKKMLAFSTPNQESSSSGQVTLPDAVLNC
jgi:cell division cycle 14